MPRKIKGGSATIGFVDAMVARKEKGGATKAELKKYRAELMKRHGLKDPTAAEKRAAEKKAAEKTAAKAA